MDTGNVTSSDTESFQKQVFCPDCINLQKRFGRQYRISYDPTYNPKHRPKGKLDPWMMQVECQRGVIYPHGGELLAAEVEGRALTRKRLADLDCTTTIQEGDGFLAVTFNVRDFPAVAKLMKPRRRRRLTEKRRREVSEQLARYRFRPQPRTSDTKPESLSPADA